jgi:hypothetical protein
LKVVRRDDGDRGGTGKVVEEFLDLAELEFGTVFDPFLLHEIVVFLRI